MTDKKVPEQAELDLNKKVSEATSSDEVRDLMIQARDDQGRFTGEKTVVAAKTEEKTEEVKTEEVKTEPVVFKDTFVIGGKEVEITGADAADVLRQYKAAMTAYDIAKTPEVKKEAEKPPVSKEELTALALRLAQGDLTAIDEYNEKTGQLDRLLAKKGINLDDVKKVLETNATADIKTRWDEEVKKFLAGSDWPGGTQNEYILKTKLAQLKDENGQPLAYNPSAENLQRAYEAMKSEDLVFKVEVKQETTETEHKTAYERSKEQPVVTEKKKATSSTLLGTSGEAKTRTASATSPKLPEITPDMDGRQIMEIFKNYAQATGQNPDEILRSAAKA